MMTYLVQVADVRPEYAIIIKYVHVLEPVESVTLTSVVTVGRAYILPFTLTLKLFCNEGKVV